MKRIILFDTSIATQNKGDEIIMESVRRELEPVYIQQGKSCKKCKSEVYLRNKSVLDQYASP